MGCFIPGYNILGYFLLQKGMSSWQEGTPASILAPIHMSARLQCV